MSFVHLVRNGLLTYIHSSLPHHLLRTSSRPDTIFYFLVDGVIQVCNVYFAAAGLNPQTLPPPTVCGMVYIGDFNARHPDLCDLSGSHNRNGVRVLSYLHSYCLTRWDTGGATHSRGGTVLWITLDYVALSLHYSLSVRPATPVTRSRIVVPPKYCLTYISYMVRVLPTFDLSSPDHLYSDLVSATHDCYKLYISRPHL